MASSFKPTEQQVAIDGGIGTSEDGERIRVEAFAGTGKTSTLELIARGSLKHDRCLYLAFNKAIKLEAEARFPRNVTAKTGHGLAYAPMKPEFIRDRDPKAGKLALARHIESDKVLYPLMDITKGDRRAAAMAVVRTIGKFCNSASPQISPEHVPPRYHVKDRRERAAILGIISGAARKVWDEICAKNSRYPIDFDMYLKAWALSRPALPYDTILLDEAQDSNPVLLGIVQPQGCRQIYVGDRHQAIYGFRDAVNAMDSILGAVFPLTQSFRFGENIAAEANIVLGMLKEERELEGVASFPGDVHDGLSSPDNIDCVLCRGNAGVIREALENMDKGHEVAIVGGGDEAAKMLYSVYDLWKRQYDPSHPKPKHPEISLFDSWEEFVEYANSDDGGAYKYMVRLADQHGSNLTSIARRLKNDTVSEERANVTISTAHKAKGREWDSVMFCDDWRPLVEADDKGQIAFHEEEARLFYVALTRAQKFLDLGGLGARTRSEAALLRNRRKPDELEVLFG